MEDYKNYVHSLLEKGYDASIIRKELLARGLLPGVIEQILEAASQPAPPTQTQAATPNKEMEPVSPPASATETQPTPPKEQDTAKPITTTFSAPISSLALKKESLLARILRPAPTTLITDMDNVPSILSARKGYLITVMLCLIPTLVIMFDAPSKMRFGTTIRTLLTLGDIFGTVGLCLYVINLVLATRLSWLEDLFGGLNKVYIAHGVIGSLALIFIMAHPVLIAIRYLPLGAYTVGDFFVPTTKYIASAYGIFALAIMLILLIITLYIHLPYKLWLWTHKFLGVAFILIALHILYEPNEISNNFFIRWYLITFVVIGILAYVYRTLLPNVFVRHYLYVIKAVKPMAAGIIEVTLAPINKVMKYSPGQFVFISFSSDGLSDEYHPFTISSAPSDGSFSITVKSLGGFTETITRVLPSLVGSSVRIEGAYGHFSYKNFHNANQVWIAGGIGITPFLGMAQSLGQGNYNIDLYYSVQSESELIDADILAGKQATKPNQVFRVFPFITQKLKHYLSVDVIAQNTGDLAGRDFLICGPPIMMDSIKKQLIARGVKKHKIHTEEFAIR